MYLEGDGSPGASRLRLRERLQRPAVAAGHGLKEKDPRTYTAFGIKSVEEGNVDRTKSAPSIETEGGSGLLCAVLAGWEVGGGVHERNVVHETPNDTQAKTHHDDYAVCKHLGTAVHAPSG